MRAKRSLRLRRFWKKISLYEPSRPPSVVISERFEGLDGRDEQIPAQSREIVRKDTSGCADVGAGGTASSAVALSSSSPARTP